MFKDLESDSVKPCELRLEGTLINLDTFSDPTGVQPLICPPF